MYESPSSFNGRTPGLYPGDESSNLSDGFLAKGLDMQNFIDVVRGIIIKILAFFVAIFVIIIVSIALFQIFIGIMKELG